MTTELTVWEQPDFAGTSLIPTPESAQFLMNPQQLVGRENVDVDDLIVPSLALLQGQSEAVTSGVPGAQPGKFQQSNSGEIYDAPLKCVLVHYHKSNAYFPPDTDKYPEAEGTEVCLSRDGVKGNIYGDCEDCGKCLNFFDDGRPPMGAQSHVFTVLTHKGPAVVRFGRTSFKAGKKFLSEWNFSSNNLWTHPVIISVSSEQKQLPGGKKSTYYKMDIHWMEEVTPEPWQAACRALYERIKGVHEEGKFGDEGESQDLGNFD